MKLWKILLLLGMYVSSTESTSDVFTTSHVQQKGNRMGNKRIKAKRHFCSQTPIQKLRCNNQKCKITTLQLQGPVCGFDSNGAKFNFTKQCQVCQNDNIKYYFKGTCDKTPKICSATEECVNGLCIQMLQQAQYSTKEVCNTKADCTDITDLCVANKCIDKRQLRKVLKVSQMKNPQLREKNDKIRFEGRKYQAIRRQKQQAQYQNLQKQIQQRRKANLNGAQNNRNQTRSKRNIVQN